MRQSKYKIDKRVILYLLLLAAALLFPMAANRRVLNIAIITLMYVTLGGVLEPALRHVRPLLDRARALFRARRLRA